MCRLSVISVFRGVFLKTMATATTPTSTENVGHLREFDPLNSDWSIYKRRNENYFSANEIKDAVRKRAILLNLLSEDAYKLVFDLCLPEEPEKKGYDVLVKLITEHFKPPSSIFAARYKFYRAVKTQNENSREWAARLRSLASPCDFEAGQLELVLRDMFVVGFNPGPVQDRFMEEKKSTKFVDMIDIAAEKSAVRTYNNEVLVKQESELLYARGNQRRSHSTGLRGNNKPAQTSHYLRSKGQFAGQLSAKKDVRFSSTSACKVCGRKNHETGQCAFRDCFCHCCKKRGILHRYVPIKIEIM